MASEAQINEKTCCQNADVLILSALMLMHRLWCEGDLYSPNGNAQNAQKEQTKKVEEHEDK
jgi:hypothetical protein